MRVENEAEKRVGSGKWVGRVERKRGKKTHQQ